MEYVPDKSFHRNKSNGMYLVIYNITFSDNFWYNMGKILASYYYISPLNLADYAVIPS